MHVTLKCLCLQLRVVELFGDTLSYFKTVLWRQKQKRIYGKATGNSRSGIPGNRGPQNSRREFPGISEILAGITGNFASSVFFPIFIVDYDILVFNLTAFWAKPWMTSLIQLFNCVYRELPVYFQILISKKSLNSVRISQTQIVTRMRTLR